MQLLLVRHGESLGNRAGRMEGRTSTGLTPQGADQARRLGRSLQERGWQPTAIYCSPLLRARQTLEALPLPPTVSTAWSDLLMEYDNGIFAGLTWAEAQQHHPQLCQQLEASLDWRPIPGSETLEAGRGRALRFWRQLRLRHQPSERVLIISHHWLLLQLLSVILGCDRTWGLAIPPTACFELWLDSERWMRPDSRWNSELWQIKRFNDCQHLES